MWTRIQTMSSSIFSKTKKFDQDAQSRYDIGAPNIQPVATHGQKFRKTTPLHLTRPFRFIQPTGIALSVSDYFSHPNKGYRYRVHPKRERHDQHTG